MYGLVACDDIIFPALPQRELRLAYTVVPRPGLWAEWPVRWHQAAGSGSPTLCLFPRLPPAFSSSPCAAWAPLVRQGSGWRSPCSTGWSRAKAPSCRSQRAGAIWRRPQCRHRALVSGMSWRWCWKSRGLVGVGGSWEHRERGRGTVTAWSSGRDWVSGEREDPPPPKKKHWDGAWRRNRVNGERQRRKKKLEQNNGGLGGMEAKSKGRHGNGHVCCVHQVPPVLRPGLEAAPAFILTTILCGWLALRGECLSRCWVGIWTLVFLF